MIVMILRTAWVTEWNIQTFPHKMKEKDLEGLFISSIVSHLFGNLVSFW